MKKCIRCGTDKDLNSFYSHPKMKDGHLNKCKECCRTQQKERSAILINDPEWLKNEQARGREKYHRLYKTKGHTGRMEISNIRRDFPIPEDKEYHHWNYNKIHSVFIMNRLNGHKRLHTFLLLDPNTQCYFNNRGELLDTRLKHENFIKEKGFEYEFINLQFRSDVS